MYLKSDMCSHKTKIACSIVWDIKFQELQEEYCGSKKTTAYNVFDINQTAMETSPNQF